MCSWTGHYLFFAPKMEVMLSTLQGTLDSRSPTADSIGVSDFLKEAWDDYNSPTTSTFVLRLGQCRSTVGNLEEVGAVTSRCSELGYPGVLDYCCKFTVVYVIKNESGASARRSPLVVFCKWCHYV